MRFYVWGIHNTHKTHAAKHARIDDTAIELESKAPFRDIPVNVETLLQDLEESFEYTRNPDQSCRQNRRDGYLGHQKHLRSIPQVAHCHGKIDDQVPEADQWREIVEKIVCIHHIREKAAQHIEPDEHCSRAPKRIIGSLVKEHSMPKTCHEDVRSD